MPVVVVVAPVAADLAADLVAVERDAPRDEHLGGGDARGAGPDDAHAPVPARTWLGGLLGAGVVAGRATRCQDRGSGLHVTAYSLRAMPFPSPPWQLSAQMWLSVFRVARHRARRPTGRDVRRRVRLLRGAGPADLPRAAPRAAARHPETAAADHRHLGGLRRVTRRRPGAVGDPEAPGRPRPRADPGRAEHPHGVRGQGRRRRDRGRSVRCLRRAPPSCACRSP